jgi:hypothetical protein
MRAATGLLEALGGPASERRPVRAELTFATITSSDTRGRDGARFGRSV